MRFQRLGRRLAAGAAAVLGSVAIVRMFPVYFRADDALYLEWAAKHPSPLAAFVPESATVLGVFRPLQDLAWWVLFRLFGLRAEPYQLLVTLLFVACLALLVRLGRRLLSPAAGWWSLVAFGVFFPYLLSVVFWFSDLSFLLESVLMLAAISVLVEALAGRASLGWVVPLYVLAVLAKEPAAFIVPAAGLAVLVARWSEIGLSSRRRGVAVVAVLCVAALVVALVHPSLHARQGALLAHGLKGLAVPIGERWHFYAVQLLGGAGIGLVAVAVLAVWLGMRPRNAPAALALWVPAVVAFGTVVFLRRIPSLGAALLVTCLLALVMLRRREGVGAAWFLVPFLGLLSISFAVRTYLFEAAFGLALVAGAALAEFASETWLDLRQSSRGVRAAAFALLVIALAVAGPRVASAVRSRLAALELVSAARLNFRDAAATLLDPSLSGDPVVIVDYADRGLDYVRDVLPLPEIEKARRQKTMMSHEVGAFLSVAGGRERTVVTLSGSAGLPAGTHALLFVMNREEDAFVGRLPFPRRLLAESARGGETARVYLVVR